MHVDKYVNLVVELWSNAAKNENLFFFFEEP